MLALLKISRLLNYKNCLKIRELHQCKNRQFYTMILKRTLSIPRSTQTNLTVHRQAVGHMKKTVDIMWVYTGCDRY